MQDEQFIREWNAGHDRFSFTLDRAAGKPGRRTHRTGQGRSAIRNIYGLPAAVERVTSADPALSPAAQASLRGLAASIITFALWVTVMVLATPNPGAATPTIATSAAAALTVELA